MSVFLLLILHLVFVISSANAFSCIGNLDRQVRGVLQDNLLRVVSHDAPTDDDTVSLPCRRAIATSATIFLITASASEAAESTAYVKGTATLQEGISTDEIGPSAALYVTARPNKSDNVPRAILDGSRGKAPPVLAARFADPRFPFEFTLTSDNLTPEGASINEGSSSNSIWWSGEDLIVSARFDSDGFAATRDPTDLVGRGMYFAKSPDIGVSIELQGRGLFGKSVTSRK